MGKYLCLYWALMLLMLGCGNVEETQPTDVVIVPTAAPAPTETEPEEPIILPITETWVDSLVLDSARTIFVFVKEGGNFGEPSLVSEIHLIEKNGTYTSSIFVASADGMFNTVSYIDSSLAKIQVDDKTQIVFFYESTLDGLDPDELVLVKTDLDHTENHKCLYYKEDGTLECDSIKEKELQLYAQPIRKAYKYDRNNWTPEKD